MRPSLGAAVARTVSYAAACRLCMLLTALAVVVAVLHPAKGYELSIYESTPALFWILVVVSTVTSITLLVREAASPRDDNRWVFALIALMANSIAVISLSMLRGYFTVGGDTLMHIGYVRDLLNGVRSPVNYYPALHLLPAIMTKIGVPIEKAVSVTPVVSYLFYVVTFYILAKFVWNNRGVTILATTMSALLLLPHGIGLTATVQAASLFPVTLLAVLGVQRNIGGRRVLLPVLLLLLVSVVVAYTHALAVEALVVVAATSVLMRHNRQKMAIVAVAVLVCASWWGVQWYGFNPVADEDQAIHVSLNGAAHDEAPTASDSVTSPATLPATASSAVSLSGMKATQTVGDDSGLSILLRRFGCEIALGFLAMLSLLFVVRRTGYGMYLGGVFLAINLLWVLGWCIQVEYYDAFLTRLLYWVPPLSVLLVAPLLGKLLDSDKHRILSVIAVTALLSAFAVWGIFRIYPSPITGVCNTQITEQEVRGINWLVDNGDPDIYIDHLNRQRISRFMALRYGALWLYGNRSNYWLAKYEPAIIGYFSYNDHQSIGEWYDEDVYLVVTKQDRLLPRWDSDRLYLLENDPAATLIYSESDEIGIWYVRGNKDSG